jgi:hypothetical protein
MITIFVFVMMLMVDYINVLSKGRMETLIRGGRWRQYTMASFLGATPGCLGAFMNVSFYVHGLLSFGAIVGGMIATSGDEAFVMLTLFPGKALLLFGILFLLGIGFARLTDLIIPFFKIEPCQECELQEVHLDEKFPFFELALRSFSRPSFLRVSLLLIFIILLIAVVTGILGQKIWDVERITFLIVLVLVSIIMATVSPHYLKEHIWSHIVKEHLWRVFLWTLFALLFINIGFGYGNLAQFIQSHPGWILLISAAVGMIPESGPHLIFVMMFANGIVPFSVLLTSSFVQDGHGIIPLLSYTVKDSLIIKLFNFVFGLSVGLALYSIGL